MELRAEVLSVLLEAAPDPMVAVGDDGSIAVANAQVEVLFGWDAADLLGRAIEVLVPPEVAAAHVQHRATYMDAPAKRPMGLGLQLSARRKDGSEFPAEISLSTIEDDSGRRYTLAAIRDITERLELQRAHQEQELSAQRERSHRLESIGQLAGGIAHDFNNLLGVILNYATLAERALDDEAIADDIRQIRAAATRAADLTRQLLTFARRDVLRTEPVELGRLVHEFADLLRRTLGERTSLEVEVADAPTTVFADRHQLEQVLLNLCINGRDAMPSGGTLLLQVGVADDDLATDFDRDLAPGPHVALRVVDEGVGMAPEVMDRALEPFFTTKGPGEGTGLGLSSAYGIVHQHRGAIRLRSVVGAGTTVEVLLPAAVPRAVDPDHDDVVRRVLLVEDEEWLRVVVARMLREHGYDVLTAADADDAEQVLADAMLPVDLLLSDVVMPGRSGPELVEHLRERRDLDAPVVYMTGYAATDRDLRGESVLSKPFSEEQLLAAVEEALDGFG